MFPRKIRSRAATGMVLSFVLLAFTVAGQRSQQPFPGPEKDPLDYKLPSGKSQRDEILKSDHAKNLEELRQLVQLATELQTELEKNDRFVLSVGALRKTEEIEKLAKRIRGRLKRF